MPTVAAPMRASGPRRTTASTRRLSRPVPRRILSRRTNPSSPRRPVDQFERLRALTDRRHHEGCLPDQFRRERRRPGALLRLTPPSFGLEDAFCSLRRALGVRAWVWSLLTSLLRAVPMGAVQPGSNGPSLCSTYRLLPNSTSSRILRRGSPRRYSQIEVAREERTVRTVPSAPLCRARVQVPKMPEMPKMPKMPKML